MSAPNDNNRGDLAHPVYVKSVQHLSFVEAMRRFRVHPAGDLGWAVVDTKHRCSRGGWFSNWHDANYFRGILVEEAANGGHDTFPSGKE